MRKLTDEQIAARLGHNVADKADNYLALSKMSGMPPLFLIDGLIQGLKEVRDEARALYVSITDENPWKERHEQVDR